MLGGSRFSPRSLTGLVTGGVSGGTIGFLLGRQTGSEFGLEPKNSEHKQQQQQQQQQRTEIPLAPAKSATSHTQELADLLNQRQRRTGGPNSESNLDESITDKSTTATSNSRWRQQQQQRQSNSSTSVAKKSTTTVASSALDRVRRFGLPESTPLLERARYVASYNDRHRTANWVCEVLTREDFQDKQQQQQQQQKPTVVTSTTVTSTGAQQLEQRRSREVAVVSRRKSRFTVDEAVLSQFRAALEDYKGSGFDRGHLAPAGNHKQTQAGLDETFLLSNITPQVGANFNRGAWNNLEQHVRGLIEGDNSVYGEVHVCSGPLYMAAQIHPISTEEDQSQVAISTAITANDEHAAEPRPAGPSTTATERVYYKHRDARGNPEVRYSQIGKNKVSVPTHFFKVILGLAPEGSEAQPEITAFIMPNEAIPSGRPLSDYAVTLENLEAAAGFCFFTRLSNRHAHVVVEAAPTSSSSTKVAGKKIKGEKEQEDGAYCEQQASSDSIHQHVRPVARSGGMGPMVT